jgi:hypothetical protein
MLNTWVLQVALSQYSNIVHSDGWALLGAPATATLASLPNVPRTLGASGILEAWWASIRTISDAPSSGL